MLNIQKGNMYGFITHTWNTIKGKCPHDCSYCYMKRWGNLKYARFDEKELKTDLGKDNFIFVGSSCDMFAEDIPIMWPFHTLLHCDKFPDNKYLFQTKNPDRFKNLKFPETSILCTTIETNRIYPQMGNTIPTIQRAFAMNEITNYKKMVTIEPIMDFDLDKLIQTIGWCGAEQVNIGADSGNNNLPEPSKEKILKLISELSEFTTVFQKDNLKRLLK